MLCIISFWQCSYITYRQYVDTLGGVCMSRTNAAVRWSSFTVCYIHWPAYNTSIDILTHGQSGVSREMTRVWCVQTTMEHANS